MVKRSLALFAVLALSASLVSGCTGELDPSVNQTAAATEGGADPEALRIQLGQIDAGLDADESIDDADEVCAQIEQQDEDAAIENEVRTRFDARAETPLTDEQVTAILNAIKAQYCG